MNEKKKKCSVTLLFTKAWHGEVALSFHLWIFLGKSVAYDHVSWHQHPGYNTGI